MAEKWTNEQKEAIELKDRNLLVSAAAGSGKTAVLVERILRLICEGENPLDVDQLLVVTFTRAAAAQMKDRLLRALEDRLLSEPDNEHIRRQTTLIHHAQITTIDGFCSYVIRNYFQSIDLDPGFRIADEGEEKLLMQDVLDKLLEDAYEEGEKDFLYLAASLDDLRGDSALEDALLRLFTISQSHAWPEDFLDSCLIPYEIENENDMLGCPWIESLMAHVKSLLKEALSLNENACYLAASPGGPAHYLPALEDDKHTIKMLLSMDAYGDMQSSLQDLKWTKLASKGPKDMLAEKKEKVQKLRESVKDLLGKKIRDSYFFDDPAEIFSDMKSSKRAAAALVSLTREFSRRFFAVKQEKNILDFADVEHLALKALVSKEGDKEERREAAKELSARFVQIMIDEYQDSNLVQEKILTAVSREAEGIHNIFMVGDVKQSIYKFRLARPELFMEKYDSYSLSDSPKRRIDLHKNFRSREEVVESVNALFSRIMTRELGGVAYDPSAYLIKGAPFEEESKGDYGTELLLMDKAEEGASELGNSRELEAHMIADRIRSMVGRELIFDEKLKKDRPVSYGDIVILLRTVKGWSDIFARVLKEKGIPAYSVSKVGYFDAREVVVVLQLLRLLDNPRQEIPLLSVLTSPIAGLDAQDLARIKNTSHDLPLYEDFSLFLENPRGDDELALKCRSFAALFDDLRRKTSYMTVKELLTEIYEKTGYLDYVSAMPAGEQRRANLLMLVEKAAEYEKTSYSGLFHFVRYIDNLKKYEVDFGEAQIGGAENNMVRIMSIHNSKGLEFPVVVAAAMGKNFNVMDTQENVMLHPDLGIGMPAIDPEQRTKKETLYHAFLKTLSREETLGEELRVLYVALTRAKQKLILTGTIKNPVKAIEDAFAALTGGDGILPYGKLYFGSCYLDWIIPGLAGTGAFKELAKEEEISGYASLTESSLPDGGYKARIIRMEDLVDSELLTQLNTRAAAELLKDPACLVTEDIKSREEISRKLDYIYPYEAYGNMPAKVSVSDLKMQHIYELKEEDGQEGDMPFKGEDPLPYLPAFMDGEKTKENPAAKRGTAYHRVMECLDYAALEKGLPVEEEIKVLTAKGMLEAADAALLRPRDFERFLESGLGKEMARAFKKGLLFRERQFFLAVDAGEVKEEYRESGESILVQGIIDAYYQTDEGLVLVDYKTDKVKQADGSDLTEKYRTQLDYYALALERLTGEKVVRKVIYSFALHKELLL